VNILLARGGTSCQSALAGASTSDDPEGSAVLEETRPHEPFPPSYDHASALLAPRVGIIRLPLGGIDLPSGTPEDIPIVADTETTQPMRAIAPLEPALDEYRPSHKHHGVKP
jgi:hypothetical protein